MWEEVGDQTELQHIDPNSYGHQHFFPVLLGCSTGSQPLWDMFLNPASSLQLVWSPNCSIGGLRAPSAGCWLSLPHLFSNWSGLQTNWLPLFTELYSSSTPTFFLWASQIALIQPIHGQSYTLLFLDQMHLLFTLVHFLFWQPSRVVGQYTKTRGWYFFLLTLFQQIKIFKFILTYLSFYFPPRCILSLNISGVMIILSEAFTWRICKRMRLEPLLNSTSCHGLILMFPHQ